MAKEAAKVEPKVKPVDEGMTDRMSENEGMNDPKYDELRKAVQDIDDDETPALVSAILVKLYDLFAPQKGRYSDHVPKLVAKYPTMLADLLVRDILSKQVDFEVGRLQRAAKVSRLAAKTLSAPSKTVKPHVTLLKGT